MKDDASWPLCSVFKNWRDVWAVNKAEDCIL